MEVQCLIEIFISALKHYVDYMPLMDLQYFSMFLNVLFACIQVYFQRNDEISV